jgi:hypothetical protein
MTSAASTNGRRRSLLDAASAGEGGYHLKPGDVDGAQSAESSYGEAAREEQGEESIQNVRLRVRDISLWEQGSVGPRRVSLLGTQTCGGAILTAAFTFPPSLDTSNFVTNITTTTVASPSGK